MRSTIARLVPERSLGFIQADDGRECSFHRGALRAARFEELARGTAVVFQIGHEAGDRPDAGPRAVSVHLAPDALPAVDPPAATA
jgi:cold shock CspA family protein